jgi:hypothetical protein
MPVPPQPTARLFTLAEAQTLLPEIEPLVAEMKSAFEKIRSEITQASTTAGLPPNSPKLAKHLEKRGVAPALVGRVNDLIRTITEKGCVVNGPEAGLVDFPALLDSEIVFLCWQHGEPHIGHWHRIPDGFAGRRPLLESGAEPRPDLSIH